MNIKTRILTRIALAASLACVIVSSAQARTVRQRKQAARSQFETAERLREALDGRPESQRTRRDYQKVIDAYRKVYYIAPTSNKADSATLAVAELLDEQGRVLNDPKSYKDAIGQLVFLRREYPGSKYRVEALFTIGEIFRDDLNDNAQAKVTVQDYLKHYPNSRLATQARQALVEIGDAEVGGNPLKKRSAKVKVQPREVKPKAAWADSALSSAPEERIARGVKDDKPAKPRTPSAKNTSEPPASDDDDATEQPVNAQTSRPDTQPHRMAHLT